MVRKIDKPVRLERLVHFLERCIIFCGLVAVKLAVILYSDLGRLLVGLASLKGDVGGRNAVLTLA